MAKGKPGKPRNDTTANLGFEAKLWAAADALRSKMDSRAQHFIFDLAASSSSGTRTARRFGVV